MLGESRWAAWARVWEGVVGIVMSQQCVVSLVLCVDDRFRFLYIVLGGFMRILGAPSVRSCCTLSI